jgi:DtxR family Mn-dependent transcriptional regulator
MLSVTEENYLKAIYHLCSEKSGKPEAGTNELAHYMGLKPATVNDMLKRLAEKSLINHKKYSKITLSQKGNKLATLLIRKHRLWETFLFEKLEFSWDEVHEVAEQLEHIHSEKLIHQLDKFLNFPNYDPHGDPIPDSKGKIPVMPTTHLTDLKAGTSGMVVAVKDTTVEFLHYLAKLKIGIGTRIRFIEVIPFDNSLIIEINKKKITVSEKLSKNIIVSKPA